MCLTAKKPLNSLLGETYEIVLDGGRCRGIAEQVSHHPPISACRVEDDDFIIDAHLYLTTDFTL